MLRRAEGGDVRRMVDLLFAMQPSTPYATLPLNRGRVTRQVALCVSRGCSWVRVTGEDVQAACLAEVTESLFGLRVLVVHAVYGEGGFWLLKKAAEDARRRGVDQIVIASSQASEDARLHAMVQRLGGMRTGSTYGVYLSWKQQ